MTRFGKDEQWIQGCSSMYYKNRSLILLTPYFPFFFLIFSSLSSFHLYLIYCNSFRCCLLVRSYCLRLFFFLPFLFTFYLNDILPL